MDWRGAIEQFDERSLEALDDAALIALEDELLLKNELSTVLRIRFTAGRVVLMLLGVLLWGVSFAICVLLTRGLPADLRGLLDAGAVFVSLAVAVLASQRIWQRMGTTARMFFRNALHYWPVLALLAVFVLVNLRG